MMAPVVGEIKNTDLPRDGCREDMLKVRGIIETKAQTANGCCPEQFRERFSELNHFFLSKWLVVVQSGAICDSGEASAESRMRCREGHWPGAFHARYKRIHIVITPRLSGRVADFPSLGEWK